MHSIPTGASTGLEEEVWGTEQCECIHFVALMGRDVATGRGVML